MLRSGRKGTRSVFVAAALGLVLAVAAAVWASTGPPSRIQSALPRSSSAPTDGDARTPDRAVPSSGDPTAPSLADQLHSMDADSLRRYVAGEESHARQAPSQSAATKGTWLVGEVGTYLVGRGVSAGEYESAGGSGGKTCRWSVRASNGNTVRTGSSTTRVVVTLHKADGFFQTNDCSNWRKIA